MKKIFIILALLLTVNSVQAHPRHYNYGYGYSGCSNCVYLLKSDFYQKTQTLPDCEDHSILIDTTINYYSNGAKRTYSTYSVVDNKKETIILSDYLDIKHVLVNNKHYFLAKNGREYKILNGKGAVRVHGGGFAGTIQAFVPKEVEAEYISQMNNIFDEGSCHKLRIRPVGGTKINLE